MLEIGFKDEVKHVGSFDEWLWVMKMVWTEWRNSHAGLVIQSETNAHDQCHNDARSDETVLLSILQGGPKNVSHHQF